MECFCLYCERIRLNDPLYHPRFSVQHEDFIRTTISLIDETSTTTEMMFSIIGDPLPLTRSVNNELFYSPNEIMSFRDCIDSLIIGHIFHPFLHSDTLQMEIYFHPLQQDIFIPKDVLTSLAEQIEQALSGLLYPNLGQVHQVLTYRSPTSSDMGMMSIFLKNEIDLINDNDYDY